MSTQTSQCVFTQLCQWHLELKRAQGPSSFCFGYFFRQKISITLQNMQASSILSWVVVVGPTMS